MKGQIEVLLVDIAGLLEQERGQVDLVHLLNVVESHVKFLGLREEPRVTLSVQNVSEQLLKS